MMLMLTSFLRDALFASTQVSDMLFEAGGTGSSNT